jgi:hypothetical protein
MKGKKLHQDGGPDKASVVDLKFSETLQHRERRAALLDSSAKLNSAAADTVRQLTSFEIDSAISFHSPQYSFL